MSAHLAQVNSESSIYAEKGTAGHLLMQAILEGSVHDPALSPVVACLPPGKKESEVKCQLIDPETDELITEGTADAVVTLEDGGILVLDWKFGQPTHVPQPDDNWQLLAYGAALVLSRGAPYFRTALWFKDVGFRWGERRFSDGDDIWAIIREIKSVNERSKEPRAVTGPHCDGCFQRKHCSAWLMPAAVGATALAPFTQPAGLTMDNAGEALRVVGAMKDAIAIAEAQLKTFAREVGGIHADGKVWAPRTVNGRRSLSLSTVEEHPDLMAEINRRRLVNEGHTYEVFSWVNAKGRAGKSNGATSTWLGKEPEARAANNNDKQPRKQRTKKSA